MLCSKPFSLRITMLWAMWSCLLSPSSLVLSSIHIPSLSLFLSVLFPLTKTDKGLSFLLACFRSLCLYCTKLGSFSYCILSLSFQRRCLGAPGPLLWDMGPASARWGRWEVYCVGGDGLVWCNGEGMCRRRKRKTDRVYYFIKCFGARQGLESKTSLLCERQGHNLPRPGSSYSLILAGSLRVLGKGDEKDGGKGTAQR